MEKLTIENFLSIRSAEIEIRRINVLIGPQASGKSVIAKLLYFFKQEIGDAFRESVRSQQSKKEFNSVLIAKFEAIFPRIYWHANNFSIGYDFDGLNVTVNGLKADSGRVALSISLSKWVYNFQLTLKNRYKLALVEARQRDQEYDDLYVKESLSIEFFIDNITKSEYSRYFENQTFIPASRTFFASLQRNIFSFLVNNIVIDYFLREFGFVYERAKNMRETLQDLSLIAADIKGEFDRLMESIIAGSYVYENEQDWISNASGKVNLANASSGQQESLPMLVVLSVLPFWGKKNRGFFIEEPEAHLFPVSQKAFISLLALLSNTTQHQFFITTHSPYLLTALNNCIMAHSTYEAADEAGKEKVLSLVPKNQHIAFEDVAAWTVTAKGTVESILDEELQLIGASILDEVSQHFETVTNELLNIRYTGQD